MKTLYTIAAFLLVMFLAVSCQKDPLPGGTAVQNMSGEWWLQTDNASGGAFGSAYSSLSTYNTAANLPAEMWMDDGNSYYGLKAKVTVDQAAKTFTATNADELYYGVKVTITKGKIVTGVAKGPGSGAVTDSISFSAVFSDSPTATFKFKGYRRTKFGEDDH